MLRIRVLLFLLILVVFLLISSEAFAQSCNSPPSGSYGPAWARQYESWCRGCCGIFSMSGGNPTCSPGTNWGCRGQGSPGISSPMGGGLYQSSYQLGQALGKVIFGDPQEEARRRARAEIEARQRNQEMMGSLDQMSKQRVQSEDQMLRNAEEQARRLEDQRRKDTLSALKGLPKTNDLAPKPATAFFGLPGNPQKNPTPPIDSSVVDLRHLDPNSPITVDPNALGENQRGSEKQKDVLKVDCERGKATRDRLAAGLPVQLEAIKRTEAQLEAARRGVEGATAEKKQILLQAAIEEAKGYAQKVLSSAEALRSQIELLKDMNINKAERDMLIRSIDTAIFEGQGLADAAQAGYESGEELKNKVDKVSKQMLSLADKLLMQSGIAEKVGEELAGKMWGPFGELGFRGARLSIDFSVAVGQGMISEDERVAAQKNLDTMRHQYREAEQRIAKIDRDLSQGCKDIPQARQ